MTLEEILRVPTAPTPAELAEDEWDDSYCCSYSQDGTRLLDAENFPSAVKVREGCQVICDGVFAFQDYMAETSHPDGEIPLEERNSFLDKITLPSSVTHIGKGAFNECGYLESIRLPKSLLSIGEEAFCDCWNLEKISLPASTRVIGPRAFQGCINLYQVRLNKNLEAIGKDAFDDCESLETILIPSGTLDRFLALLPQELHECIEEI
ncbi:MAG: leucine-rich repeat domain-containing protein [Bacteroidales bacterium]|nr:leucine-rich repeat domain-containing protein [Bacteroidales bacterium]